ncbi:MAG: glycoside hydrolase family 28 protein [Bacteroidales bacterium]|nr:glycoside hydrolase family 28 protein [Bacteroidales bacterium]
MRVILCFVLFFPISTVPLIARDYCITDFGAVSDTSVINTEAIQAAIDACSQNQGGKVIIPAGNYVTGTLILKDHVTLYLTRGAILFGSRNIQDYDRIKPDFVALRTREETRQLIYAENVQDITISGEGTIDGQGWAFPQTSGDEGITRPHLIQLINCYNILIENLSLQNSGAWMQHYLACEQLQIRGINVYNHSNKNNDGIDVDGCKNVIIANVTIDSDDDGICMKSTSDAGCENITITNCLISSHCNALKMGTESNTGFKNIVISNIVIQPSRVRDNKIYGDIKGISGISLEIVDGGTMDGIVISNIRIEGTLSPLFIRLGNRARPYRDDEIIENVGTIKNIMISDVVATKTTDLGCSITGIPGHPVENVYLNDIVVEFEGNGTIDDIERKIPERETDYPEATMFGKLPAYGFFIRHAQNMNFSRIDLRTNNPDARPGLFLEDIRDSKFQQITLQSDSTNKANIFIKEANNITFSGFSISGLSNRFIDISGTSNKDIILMNNSFHNVNEVYNEEIWPDGLIHQSGNLK